MTQSETVQEATASNAPSPTSASQRIQSLDLLRGFALLGILVVNIQAMAMPAATYSNPTAFEDFSGLNYVVWLVTVGLFDSKMMSIFSMLFGAGIVLMTERAQRRGGKSFWLHARRMFWLFLFGLAHAHLIWWGDILFTYAICGSIVYFARTWSPKFLIPGGLCLILIPAILYFLFGLLFNMLDEETIAKNSADWTPSAEAIQDELDAYRGSWLKQQPFRSELALIMETFVFGILFFWRASGLMLLGMAFYKMGILTAEKSSRWLFSAGMISLAIGFPVVMYGIWKNLDAGFDLQYSKFFGVLPNYLASVPVAFGYVCLIVLFSKANVLLWLKHSLQSVGQMALTNYLTQSIICTTVFYGHGFGWFGYASRLEQFGVVIGVWLLQMIWSPVWLRYFRFGPFEWLWRSLVYWKRQPMRIQRTPDQ